MITYKEFEVIRTMLKLDQQVQDLAKTVYETIPYYAFKSVEEVTDLIASLEKKGLIQNGKATPLAMEEIAPLKVDNAVILAAGGSDISAKSVYLSLIHI